MGEFFNNLNQISKEPTYQNEWQQSEFNIPKYDQNYIHPENELIYIYNNNNQNYNIIYQNQMISTLIINPMLNEKDMHPNYHLNLNSNLGQIQESQSNTASKH